MTEVAGCSLRPLRPSALKTLYRASRRVAVAAAVRVVQWHIGTLNQCMLDSVAQHTSHLGASARTSCREVPIKEEQGSLQGAW
jgi:hypothetical protein